MNGAWHRIFFWGFAAILLLPLLNIPPLFSPPAWGQTVAFRTIFIPLFLFLLWQLLKTRGLSAFIPHGSARIPWALLYGLGGVFLLATTLSVDSVRSFWDDPSRGWGTLNYLLYIAFAVSLFLILKTQEWRRAWYVLLGTGVGLSLLAVFQNLGLFGGTLISYGRPVATLGNPLFLAMTLVPLAIMGFVWFLQGHKSKLRWILGAMLLLFLYAIFLTLSRGALIGLGAGIAFLLFFAFNKQRRLIQTAVFGLLLVGMLSFWYATANPELPQFLKFLPNADTLWYRLSLEHNLGDARFAAWKIAGEAALARPMLGYGPYNASLAFDRFYDPTLGPVSNSIGWWDTSHNVFIDLLVGAGVLGLGVFLAFLGALFWKLHQARRQNPELRLQVIGVQAALIGFLVNGLFSFNTFATYLVFFFLVAYAFHLISTAFPQSESPAANSLPRTQSRGQSPIVYPERSRGANIRLALFGLFALFAAWFLWQHNVAPLWTNKEMNVAVFQAQNGNCQQAIQKAEGLSSPSPQLNYYLPAQYTNVIRACLPNGAEDAQTRVLLSLKAAQLLDEAAAARPQYSRTYLTKADYLNIALSYVAQGEQKDAIAREAEAAIQRARDISPEREELYKRWAQTARLRGSYEEAITHADRCLALYGEIEDCIWERALANVSLGNLGAADNDIAELVERRHLPSSWVSQLAALYQSMERYDLLAEFYEQVMPITPSPQYAGFLARAYQELGEWGKAHEATLFVLQQQPELRSQVEEFLQPIREVLQQECGGSASSCWRLSLVELTLGNNQEAVAARTKAEQLGFPVSSEQALRNLAEVHDANQDIPRLIETYEKLARSVDDPRGVYHKLAKLYLEQKEYDKTRAALEQLLRIDRENTAALNMLKELSQ